MARSTTSTLDRAARGGPAAASALPPSPPAARVGAARWRDARVLAGVALVVACVVLGVRLTSMGEPRAEVWRATRDLAAGAPVTLGDLEPVSLPLGDVAAEYLSTGTEPGGRLLRELRSGELVPVDALGAAAPSDVRLVTVPVEPLHAPADVAAGDRVDVWSTPREDVDSGAARPALVLRAALVSGGDAGVVGVAGESGVVLEVPSADAATLLAAVRSGAVDLVRVPVGSR
jgi:hypothetical protein